MEWAKEYKRCILDTIQAEAEHSCEKDLGNRVNAVKWKEALKGRLRSDRLSQAGFGDVSRRLQQQTKHVASGAGLEMKVRMQS